MEKLIHFVIHHWMLVSLLVIALILLFVEELRSKTLGTRGLNPQQVVQKINSENALIVDIREEKTFAAGHIIGSINIPQEQLENKIQKIEKYKDKPLIIVCNTGLQAKNIMQKLQKLSFKEIYILNGGIQAWKTHHLPLTSKNL